MCAEDFLCFLPDRFSKVVSTDLQLAELNEELESITYSLKYDGKDPKRKNYIVDFIKTPKEQAAERDWEWNDLLTMKTKK